MVVEVDVEQPARGCLHPRGSSGGARFSYSKYVDARLRSGFTATAVKSKCYSVRRVMR